MVTGIVNPKMIYSKHVTLDTKVTEVIHPYTDWTPEALKKWAFEVGEIDPTRPYETITDDDGTVLFFQAGIGPALRFYDDPNNY